MIGVSAFPLIPQKAEPSDKSELLNQLLFGEEYTVIEETEKWLKIKTIRDEYVGWIDRKLHTPLQQGSLINPVEIVNSHLHTVVNQTLGHLMHIPMGSIFPAEPIFSWGQWQFEIMNHSPSSASWETVAQSFLGSPYLWGGKTHFGIDCSGFSQVVLRTQNVWIPRDAWQQEQFFENNISFSDHKKGDLAFFSNEQGRVTHVGIIREPGKIIHCSGQCRIDELTENGIFNQANKTHHLHSIKRWLDT
ncbi:MAG TPA: C40 family peptidase [Luteibaculaceae bacterium]|nr:C40 family peptidase [Luteibaculaceae bacterium]